MKVKADRIETDNRVRAIQEWILQGQTTVDIIRQCTIKWNISQRQAYRIFEKAYDEFHDMRHNSLKRRLSYHLESRLKLFREMKDKNTPNGARSACMILDSMAKLEGVMVEKHEHTGKDGAPIETKSTIDISKLSEEDQEMLAIVSRKLRNDNGK